jgi:RES domain-containing protein
MISAFRLCKTQYLATAMSGEGARLNGGRWNSAGVAVVYTASSLSLATLEILVHLEDAVVFARLFSWVKLDIPENLVDWADLSTLPNNWSSDEGSLAARSLGDTWLRRLSSAVFAVPSAVTPGEWNYLINSVHPDVSKIQIGEACRFQPDSRLVS